MQETAPLKSGVALFHGVWFDAYIEINNGETKVYRDGSLLEKGYEKIKIKRN